VNRSNHSAPQQWIIHHAGRRLLCGIAGFCSWQAKSYLSQVVWSSSLTVTVFYGKSLLCFNPQYTTQKNIHSPLWKVEEWFFDISACHSHISQRKFSARVVIPTFPAEV
jgi:hypothetical protein